MSTVYFYHTQDIQHILERMKVGEFPPHFLYGATKLPDEGIGVVYHEYCQPMSRWRMMLRNTWRILTCRQHFDAIYATHYRGIEPIIMLRALGLYRKPIVVWHHQPIVTPRQWWREWLGRVFYRGFDRMIFFSRQLIETSLQSRKARRDRMIEGHWGADIAFYDRVLSQVEPSDKPFLFISTGKELRDMPTLVEAFGRTQQHLEIIIARHAGTIDYEAMFRQLQLKPNIHLNFCDGLKPYEISLRVAEAQCVVICCQPSKYTVGLTTLVEALALGKPIITTRNQTFPVDVDREHCGISVPYSDPQAWTEAISYIATHPTEAKQMGIRGRQIALTRYNDQICSKQVADVIKHVLIKK